MPLPYRSIQLLRFQKLLFSIFHSSCWKALAHGVAPSIEHRRTLASLNFDFIIDVGANRGQFSLISRLVKTRMPIVAFEPLPREAKIFRKVFFGKDVQLHQVALGDKAGEADIHLSRSADSSSLLAIGKMQTDLFPTTYEIGVLKVPIKRLDDFESDWRVIRGYY